MPVVRRPVPASADRPSRALVEFVFRLIHRAASAQIMERCPGLQVLSTKGLVSAFPALTPSDKGK
ncbi:hypothetical protein GCM10010245_22260 [Streptomyces spectabilis]|nr:hypothetical protein GCM10010245_22260 [Streptomyces spectabilis]